MKRYNRKKNIRWNTMKILVTGFLLVIVTGAVLLWLPVSNQKPIEFFDALFTSASAVCVTGLVTIIPQIFIHKKPDFCVKNFFFNGTSDAIIAVQ